MAHEVAVGTFTPSVLLRLARRTGLLETHGVTVREERVASSPGQFRALLAGHLGAALTSPDNVVAYRFSPDNPLGVTADVRIRMAVDRGLGLGVYCRPGLTGAADLRGGVVGVDVAASGFAFALYEVLAAQGLRREDYGLVEIGSTPRRLHALLAAECDATMLNAGNDLLAVDAGCSRIARVVDVCKPYLGTVLCVTGGAPAEETAGLAAALRETMQLVVSGQAYDAAAAEAVDALGLREPLARRFAQRLSDPDEGLVADGVPDAASMATIVRLRRRHHPSSAGDREGLERALDAGSGLIDTAWPDDG